MEYFTDKDKDAMLRECYDFDKELIHEKYKEFVINLEKEGENNDQDP